MTDETDSNVVLTPQNLDDEWLARNPRERTDDAIAKVEVQSLERGTLTVYLEPGEAFEVREDGPNKVTVTSLADSRSATEPNHDN